MAYPVNTIFKQQWNSAHVPRRKSNGLKTESPNLVHLASSDKVAGEKTMDCRGYTLQCSSVCSYFGSVMVFQLAPLLECDDIPVALMSALGAGARPAPCQHAMEHDWSDLDVCIYA